MKKRIFPCSSIMVLQSLTLAGSGNKEAKPSEITYTLTMVVKDNGTSSQAVSDHT